MVAVGRNRSVWRLVSAAVAAAGGAYLGYTFGSGFGSPILTEWFSAFVALALAILILILLVVVALLIRWKSTNSDPALRSVIRVGALFVAGIALGWVLSAFFASA
jgi:uncharacterized membrane protein